MTHTTGPWIEGEQNSKGEVNIYAPNGGRTASNTIAFAALPHNARLIAAAPELLEALTDILEDYDHAGERHVTQQSINKAKRAIAKALGTPPLRS